jgi:hypothetical protein
MDPTILHGIDPCDELLVPKTSFLSLRPSLPIPNLQKLNRSAWESCNHLIHSWNINSIYDYIAQTLVFYENVIDVWEDLRVRFAKVDHIQFILFGLLLTTSNKVPFCT